MENFQVSLKLQLNKDIKNPAMPGSVDYPQIEAVIIIGDETKKSDQNWRTDDSQQHGDANALTFSIYQPQVMRILKTLEIIGWFNEFKEGANL